MHPCPPDCILKRLLMGRFEPPCKGHDHVHPERPPMHHDLAVRAPCTDPAPSTHETPTTHLSTQPPCIHRQGCIRREEASEAAPEAVRQAV